MTDTFYLDSKMSEDAKRLLVLRAIARQSRNTEEEWVALDMLGLM